MVTRLFCPELVFAEVVLLGKVLVLELEEREVLLLLTKKMFVYSVIDSQLLLKWVMQILNGF